MANANFKTLLFYDKRRVQPETLERIIAAKDGDLIGMDTIELEAFRQVMILTSKIDQLQSPAAEGEAPTSFGKHAKAEGKK